MVNESTWNCDQKCEFCKLAVTVAAQLPLGTTGKICSKSPPKMIGILPKYPALFAISQISFRVRFTASKQYLCCIGTSSQMIKLVCLINSAKCVPWAILHIEVSVTAKGILNRECAVRPPSNYSAAMPEDAIQRTTFPLPRK